MLLPTSTQKPLNNFSKDIKVGLLAASRFDMILEAILIIYHIA